MGKKLSKHKSSAPPPAPIEVSLGSAGSGTAAFKYAQTKHELSLVTKLSNPMSSPGSITTLLMKHFNEGGVADVRVSDGSQRTLLMLALQSRHVDAARTLLDRGAALDARTAKGLTPLMLLLSEVPPPNSDLVRTMVERQADVQATDNEGRTALMHAFASGSVDMDSVRLLIERGASVNISDRDGATAMMHAAKALFHLIKTNKVEECIQLFASRGAQLNERDVSGDSVLVHWAIQAALRQKEPKKTLDALFQAGVRLDPSDVERLEYKKKRAPERQQGEPNEAFQQRQRVVDSYNHDIDGVVGVLREYLATGQYRLAPAGSGGPGFGAGGSAHYPPRSPSLQPTGAGRPSPFVPAASVSESQRPGPGAMQRFAL
eukprot:tig00000870_g5157.t1